jgi:hypothetical protein
LCSLQFLLLSYSFFCFLFFLPSSTSFLNSYYVLLQHKNSSSFNSSFAITILCFLFPYFDKFPTPFTIIVDNYIFSFPNCFISSLYKCIITFMILLSIDQERFIVNSRTLCHIVCAFVFRLTFTFLLFQMFDWHSPERAQMVNLI